MEHCMFNEDHTCYGIFVENQNSTLTWYEYTNLVLVSSLIYLSGFCFSSWIVGKYILKPLPEPVKIVKKKYEDKYCLDDMQKDLSRNNEVTKNTSVMELTPDGNVIMRYNKEREGFEYWCNNQNIKYDYLETVARKFVIMNFCTNLYIDRNKDIKEQHEELDRKEEEKKKNKEKKNEEKEEEEKSEEESVFVKSKLSVEKKQEEEMVDRKKIAAKKSNKYLYMGKLKDFEWLRKPKEKNSKNDISFSNFKSLFLNSTQ